MNKDYRIVESKSGIPTLMLGDKFLHSKYDPKEEARREIEEIAKENPSAVVILGTGLGYSVDAALELLPYVRILAVESDPELFNLMEQTRGIRKNNQVFYLVGKNEAANFDTITRCIDSASASNVTYLYRLAELDTNYYSNIAHLVGRVSEMHIESLSSMIRFGFLWWENSVRNYKEWSSLPDVADWFGAFRETPVIIFAAGPTLENSLNIFSKGEGGIRFAVDTAYPILEKAGIRIDAVFAIDAQKLTLKHFEKLRPKLLAGAPVIPHYLWEIAEQAVIMSLDGPHFQWFEEALNRKIAKLKSGGSVTTFAFDLARRMAAPQIILVGADFAHKEGKTHSPGTAYEKMNIERTSRFFNSEILSWKNSIKYGEYSTKEQLAQYAQWMNWEISTTRSNVYRVEKFGLLTDVPVMNKEMLLKIVNSDKPSFFIPKPPITNIRRIIEGFKTEKASLEIALQGELKALESLSGFFDPIIRPFAVVSKRETLSKEALEILISKLRDADKILNEIIFSQTN